MKEATVAARVVAAKDAREVPFFAGTGFGSGGQVEVRGSQKNPGRGQVQVSHTSHCSSLDP